MLTPAPPDRTAPGAIAALQYAELRGLAERHAVSILTPAGPDWSEREAAQRLAGEGWDVRIVGRHLGAGTTRWRRRARLVARWACWREPWRTIWYHEPLVQDALDTMIRGEAFDVILVGDNAMATYRLAAGGTALVLSDTEVRHPRAFDWRLGPPREWPAWAFRELDWRRWPRYQRQVWQRFDAIQFVSERDADAARALAPAVADRMYVNPFGIVLPERKPGSELGDIVAFVGNYTHPPNVDAATWLAREIMPRVRQRVPTARLQLAGIHAPPVVSALASQAVQVRGFLDDVDDFLRVATVVAAPVRAGGGMRMKVLHALALGKAVVTTSLGAEGLSVATGQPPLVVADDAEGIALAVARLLEDADERARLGAAARAFVEEHHSPQAYARRLESVCEAAIRAACGRRLDSRRDARESRGVRY